MSVALKRLRETFDDELVRYERGQVFYSPLAEELRPQVAEILERSSKLIETARRFDPLSFRGLVTICAPQSTLGFFHAALVAALAITAPEMSIRSVAYPPAPEVEDRIDIFIVPRWLASSLAPARPLFVEDFHCLVSADCPLDDMDENSFLSCRHAALPPGEEEIFWPEGSPARALLARRRIAARAAQCDALRFLVMQNGLIATTTSRMAQMQAMTSRTVPVPAPPAFERVVLVAQAKPGRASEPAMRWLIGEMERIAVPYNPLALMDDLVR